VGLPVLMGAVTGRSGSLLVGDVTIITRLQRGGILSKGILWTWTKGAVGPAAL
jgi:hypothetical protein